MVYTDGACASGRSLWSGTNQNGITFYKTVVIWLTGLVPQINFEIVSLLLLFTFPDFFNENLMNYITVSSV
jgi:hypothetical protein